MQVTHGKRRARPPISQRTGAAGFCAGRETQNDADAPSSMSGGVAEGANGDTRTAGRQRRAGQYH